MGAKNKDDDLLGGNKTTNKHSSTTELYKAAQTQTDPIANAQSNLTSYYTTLAQSTPTLNYQNYTYTPLSGTQNYSAVAMPNMESYSALEAPTLQDYVYQYLNYAAFNDEYADYIKDAVDAMQNRQPFNYDYTQDESYKQYADAYKRSGQLAMEDTLAKLASRTGGLASSYAAAASQQAYNAYMQELANKIPELRELAYNKYQDDIANQRADLATYMDLSNTAYQRYSDDRDLAYNENALMNEYGYANNQMQNNLKLQDWQNRQTVANGNVDIRNNAALQNWANQQSVANSNVDLANSIAQYNNQMLNSTNQANAELYNSAQQALYNSRMSDRQRALSMLESYTPAAAADDKDYVIINKTSGTGPNAKVYVERLGWRTGAELDDLLERGLVSEEIRGNGVYYRAIAQDAR